MIALEAVALTRAASAAPNAATTEPPQEMYADAELRARDVALRREQATVPTRTTVPSVA